MSKSYDAIIIGGGHNGLVTAALLAKAGRSVLVLERRKMAGGAAVTEEIFPGFKVNTGAHDAGLFRPEVVEALRLEQHGLEFIESPVVAFAPQPDGKALTLWRDLEKSQVEIASFSEADAEKFPAFIGAVQYITGKLDSLMTRTPPSLDEESINQFLPWFQAGLGIERLSRRELADFVRVIFLSAAEFLDEWFENDVLKGLLATSGITGTMQGPKSPGTAFTMLYHYLGGAETGFRASRFVRGGIGQLTTALISAAREQGAEIETGLEVSQIITGNGQATGVRLADGAKISAKVIVSSADPRRTFFDLVGATNLEVRFMRKVKSIRYRGCTAKVNLALSGLPHFTTLAPSLPLTHDGDQGWELSGHILISPSPDYLERAYDDAKYGRLSEQPYLDVVIPSLLDPTLAPAGQHTMSIVMQYAPYRLRQSNWAEQRERLGDKIIETLAHYAPNLKELILHRQILTPLDWEQSYGLPEGSIYHGQMELDQVLFMRPVAGYAQYRTPVRNLYLCGAGTHPGGGLTGAPGYNAAREILKDWK
jgi:phytoene dehydrogenase-like protein